MYISGRRGELPLCKPSRVLSRSAGESAVYFIGMRRRPPGDRPNAGRHAAAVIYGSIVMRVGQVKWR